MDTAYITIFISFVGLLIAILSFVNTKKKDDRTDIQESMNAMNGMKESLLKCNMKLDQICATTNETRSDIKSMDKSIQGIDKRTTILERDVKTAFNRIEEIERRIAK